MRQNKKVVFQKPKEESASSAAEGGGKMKAESANKTDRIGRAHVLRPVDTQKEKSEPWSSALKPQRWERHNNGTHSECRRFHIQGLQSPANMAQLQSWDISKQISTLSPWGRVGVKVSSKRRRKEQEDFQLSFTDLHYGLSFYHMMQSEPSKALTC